MPTIVGVLHEAEIYELLLVGGEELPGFGSREFAAELPLQFGAGLPERERSLDRCLFRTNRTSFAKTTTQQRTNECTSRESSDDDSTDSCSRCTSHPSRRSSQSSSARPDTSSSTDGGAPAAAEQPPPDERALPRPNRPLARRSRVGSS